MGILNIAPAERAGAHLLIQLYGPPRSGKTYTALRIARGTQVDRHRRPGPHPRRPRSARRDQSRHQPCHPGYQ